MGKEKISARGEGETLRLAQGQIRPGSWQVKRDQKAAPEVPVMPLTDPECCRRCATRDAEPDQMRGADQRDAQNS